MFLLIYLSFHTYNLIFFAIVINITTNRCVKILGKPENARFVQLSLFQGSAKKPRAAVTVEMQASENPALQNTLPDPTLFCTAFKKNRFYMFTRRELDDVKRFVLLIPCLHGAKIIRIAIWIVIWIAIWIEIQKMYPLTQDIH